MVKKNFFGRYIFMLLFTILIFLFGSDVVHGSNVSQGPTPSYTTEKGGGTYPTNYWQPTGQANVRNHQGGTANGWDKNTSWNADPADTTNSYFKFGSDSKDPDYAIRKYARETNTPGLYDLYLNVRGNSQKDIKPVDIVLVVDMSGSMEENGRAQAVRSGIKAFLSQIKQAGIGDYVNVGLVGYSSPRYISSSGYIKVGLGKVSDSSHQNDINNALSGRFTGGTYTQMGLRQGTQMLNSDQSGNKKMMILLSDGVPTFSDHVITSEKDSDGTIYGKTFSNNKRDEPGNTSEFKGGWFGVRSYQDESHNQINDTWAATLGEARLAKNSGTEIHTLGIQLSNDGRYLSQQEVRDRMRKIASPNMYEDAENADDVGKYLQEQAQDVVSSFNTIVNGSISDPLGNQFEYASNSVDVRSVGQEKVEDSALPQAQINDKEMSVTGLNLGKDQEIQVHYQIHINTEDAKFVPDQWYPMNGTTTLIPRGDDPTGKVDFGVPSAKAPGVKVNITKIWNNLPGSKVPENINFTVSRSNVVDSNSWIKATGVLAAKDDWKKQFEKLNVGSSEVFLPKFNNNGQIFKYEVTSEDPVTGYVPTFENKDDNLTITNTALGFRVEKFASNSDDKLSGALFKLVKYSEDWKNKDSTATEQEIKANSDLTGIKPGYYTIQETNAPVGFNLNPEPFKFQVTEKGEFLSENGIPISNDNVPNQNGFYVDKKQGGSTLVYVQYDEIKPFELTITKEDQDSNKKLKDVTFKLVGAGKETEVTTDQEGIAKFSDLKTGDYTLSETKAPNGYSPLGRELKVTINKDGSVTLPGGSEGSFDLKPGATANTIQLTIKNKAKGVLPKTGGQGIDIYLIVGLSIILISMGIAIVYQHNNKQEV